MGLYDPIKIGSAAGSDLTPEPGWEIKTNEFNSDICELTYSFGDISTAASNRPVRGDIYAGSISPLSGFRVHDSSLAGHEGKAAGFTALYKKPRYDLVVLPVGDSELKVSGNQVGDILKFPESTQTRRYVSQYRPDNRIGRIISDTSGFNMGFPPLATLQIAWTNAAGTWDAPHTWRNVKLVVVPQCVSGSGAFYYEVTEVWKGYSAFTAATP